MQYVGRVLRSAPGKHTVEVRDYHDVETVALASSLRKRAPGYRSLGFADPSTVARSRPAPDAGTGELCDMLPPDRAADELDGVAGTVARLRREGLLITHDGATWSLTPA